MDRILALQKLSVSFASENVAANSTMSYFLCLHLVLLASRNS